MNNLNNKKVLLIICGGIAAYKSLEIIRLLKKSGVIIKTILTKSGAEFVTPLSITSLSQSRVYQDLFSIEDEAEMPFKYIIKDCEPVIPVVGFPSSLLKVKVCDSSS